MFGFIDSGPIRSKIKIKYTMNQSSIRRTVFLSKPSQGRERILESISMLPSDDASGKCEPGRVLGVT
jgi:hypothetical protein